ncbi:hypothetical protein [Yellowstone lake mimivirus]|uniref:hypothetical protein n=1 Tax=Yellowstone lake mimivirus TaxID=1586712 RepID=UPI0006EBA316|nr:hypothetical protein AR680_gp050 [Yellowstone lake mimivirus]BAT21974.1 hypothetical protein [Yellowstone lake mimivirus]
MSILTAFNDHFFEFVNAIQEIFPDDHDLLVSKNSLMLVRKANPKMIVKIWNAYVVGKYKSEIEAGNLDFFINKDYSSDFINANNSDKIIESIDRFRQPIKNMSEQNKLKSIKYIQNLTKLAALCEI